MPPKLPKKAVAVFIVSLLLGCSSDSPSTFQIQQNSGYFSCVGQQDRRSFEDVRDVDLSPDVEVVSETGIVFSRSNPGKILILSPGIFLDLYCNTVIELPGIGELSDEDFKPLPKGWYERLPQAAEQAKLAAIETCIPKNVPGSIVSSSSYNIRIGGKIGTVSSGASCQQIVGMSTVAFRVEANSKDSWIVFVFGDGVALYRNNHDDKS